MGYAYSKNNLLLALSSDLTRYVVFPFVGCDNSMSGPGGWGLVEK